MVKVKKIKTLDRCFFVNLIMYGFICALAVCFSYFVRFDGFVSPMHLRQMFKIMPWVVLGQLSALFLGGQLLALVKYYSSIDVKTQFTVLTFATLLLYVISSLCGYNVPRGVLVINIVSVNLAIALVRTLIKNFESIKKRIEINFNRKHSGKTRATAIVGAGSVGSALIRELNSRPDLLLQPVVVFDDDESKWGKRLHGVPIVGKPEMLSGYPWVKKIDRVILAIPNAAAPRVREIVKVGTSIGIAADTVPSIDQLVTGNVRVSHLRPINISDLLRRPIVSISSVDVSTIIRGKVVAVTGAGGSIGSELCRQILNNQPKVIVLIDHSEFLLYTIEREIIRRNVDVKVVPILADICELPRIREIFGRYRPQTVFHAAAYKHVPLIEGQPGQAIKNNTFGSANLMRIAVEYSVERFVLISTDKAINPTNAMGASKRLAELFLQSYYGSKLGSTRMMAVRFGNVLGSSGSVVPMFQEQIESGGPLTVTHSDVTRYFMTIPEAVALVLQAGTIGVGGEIFVLDMGQPIRIADLAKQMIELAGFKPDVDIQIKYTGLRPGEKMFEEISHQKEQLVPTSHSKIFRFVSTSVDLFQLEIQFKDLSRVIESGDVDQIKKALQKVLPEYKPELTGRGY